MESEGFREKKEPNLDKKNGRVWVLMYRGYIVDDSDGLHTS